MWMMVNVCICIQEAASKIQWKAQQTLGAVTMTLAGAHTSHRGAVMGTHTWSPGLV